MGVIIVMSQGCYEENQGNMRIKRVVGSMKSTLNALERFKKGKLVKNKTT